MCKCIYSYKHIYIAIILLCDRYYDNCYNIHICIYTYLLMPIYVYVCMYIPILHTTLYSSCDNYI